MPQVVEQPPRNRILEDLAFQAQQEAEYRIANPASKRADPFALELRQNYYQSVLAAYRSSRGLTGLERNTKRFIRHELRKMAAQRQPRVLTSILYNRFVNRIVNSLLKRQDNYTTHDKALASYEKYTAMEHNYRNLAESLQQIGLHHQLEQQLKRGMANNKPEFYIRHNEPGVKDANLVLHFKKLPGTDAYYFSAFDVLARPTVLSGLKTDNSTPRMRFSVTEGLPFNAQEAANMVNGRPLRKMVDAERVWLGRDPQNPIGLVHLEPIDLLAALHEHSLKELTQFTEKNTLVSSLQAGNKADATYILADGSERPIKIGLSADGQSLHFFNPEGRQVDIRDYIARGTVAHTLQQQAHTMSLQPAKVSMSI